MDIKNLGQKISQPRKADLVKETISYDEMGKNLSSRKRQKKKTGG